MTVQSVAIAALCGTFLLIAGPTAQAQTQPQAQGEAAPAQGKKRSIVSVPSAGSNAANSAVQSGVRSARDDAARKAKARQMQ